MASAGGPPTHAGAPTCRVVAVFVIAEKPSDSVGAVPLARRGDSTSSASEGVGKTLDPAVVHPQLALRGG
jgi:hypothetical protein